MLRPLCPRLCQLKRNSPGFRSGPGSLITTFKHRRSARAPEAIQAGAFMFSGRYTYTPRETSRSPLTCRKSWWSSSSDGRWFAVRSRPWRLPTFALNHLLGQSVLLTLIGSWRWVIKRDRGRPAEFDSRRRQLSGAFGTDNTQTWLLVSAAERTRDAEGPAIWTCGGRFEVNSGWLHAPILP